MDYPTFLNGTRFFKTFGLSLVLVLSGLTNCFYDCRAQATFKPKSPKTRFMNFGGKRNRFSFRLLKDPKLSKYFAPDFIWDVSNFQDRNEFLRMTAALRSANPTIIIGSYASACTTMPEKKDYYPPAKMPLKQCKSEWLLRTAGGSLITWPEMQDRYFLDMRRRDVREAMISLAVARAKHNGLDAVCFDNCYWGIVPKDFPVSKREWTDAFMSFYAEAGKATHEAGLKCVVNVAAYATEIPNAFRAIAPYVDGIMTESAFHPLVRTPEELLRELKAYEEVLKQGKMVLLFPRYREDEQFALLAIRPLARKYGNIYLNATGPIHDEPLYRLADIEWDVAVD